MLKQITKVLLLTTISMALLYACGTGPDNVREAVNPNIVLIKDCCEIGELLSGDIQYGYNRGDTIFYIGGLFGYVKVDHSFNIQKDSVFSPSDYINQLSGQRITYMSGITPSDVFLSVVSSFSDVSIGRLYEYNLISNQFSLLKDSTYNISSANYWHGDSSKLVYYSYGNDLGLEAGYYLADISADSDSLLLAHRSPIGPEEVINGFDLSPDNSKLLYPNVRASFTNPERPQTPQIVEYNLQTQQADTFDVSFDMSFVRVGLWLRYSPSGDRILYANFPLNSFTSTTNDDSEVGIIELPALTKRILDINTNPEGEQRSVQLAPTWSPDGNHIIYGSAPVFFPSGSKGAYSLYLLKNVDDPRNFN